MVLWASIGLDPSKRSPRFPSLPDPPRGRVFGHRQRCPDAGRRSASVVLTPSGVVAYELGVLGTESVLNGLRPCLARNAANLCRLGQNPTAPLQ